MAILGTLTAPNIADLAFLAEGSTYSANFKEPIAEVVAANIAAYSTSIRELKIGCSMECYLELVLNRLTAFWL